MSRFIHFLWLFRASVVYTLALASAYAFADEPVSFEELRDAVVVRENAAERFRWHYRCVRLRLASEDSRSKLRGGGTPEAHKAGCLRLARSGGHVLHKRHCSL